jgi:hypothetical protein
MKRKRLILILMMCTLIGTKANVYASLDDEIPMEEYDQTMKWNKMIHSIIAVESNGNASAVSPCKQYVGILQIHKIVVDDCNEWLALNGVKKRYTYKDRLNEKKSIEIFNTYQERYNKDKDINKAIRIWNGGCNYKKKATQHYYNKVMAEYSKEE